MKLGLVIHSYWQRWRGKYASDTRPPFTDALQVLDHCHVLGVPSLQIMVDKWTDDFATKVRAKREALGIAIEGSITLPGDEAEVPHFEATLLRAKEAGASVFRTLLGGRRYELFESHAAFLDAKKQAVKSMQLAAPIAENHGVRIGVENHKDFHAAELADMLTALASPAIGACIDTGNNLALLEDPMQVVETLAPFAVTVHLKDMAVQPHREGFLLSEVPLGEGILDLQGVIDLIHQHQKDLPMHLEMITRDPLHIGCLTPRYWATFPDKPASELAMALASVNHFAAPSLPTVSGLSKDDALEVEEQHILASLKYAAAHFTGG
jgi:3-oxoisoapionate decarboxylase